MRHEDESKSVGICRKNVIWQFMINVYDILHGRVGIPICLKGRRETLYPKMNRREVHSLADEICRWAAESAKS